MPSFSQAQKAEALLALHHGPKILVLPNAWDCASARLVERAGFPAIATSSAAIASSLGFADGQNIPRQEMLAVVKRIAACVELPVTADLEAGYGNIMETARELAAAGAVGLNLEDIESGQPDLVDIPAQVEKIKTLRSASETMGIRIFINARTDVYLAQIGDPSSRFDRACERLKAYAEAGADCLFIPGIKDEALIRAFVEALKFPVNVLAVAGSPSIPRLQELGVARVSLGSGVARATLGLVDRILAELKQTGSYDAMTAGALPYAEVNALF
ncbi:MAG: isocitrate lyase/phosphoenolpyruvate mutase family protein, partial [Acidobacteriaceae bacterium]